MSGSVVVDVAIGLVLLYLLIALFCTAIQEWLAQIFNLRARHLQAAVKVLLGGTTQGNADAQAVLGHPLFKVLSLTSSKSFGPRDPAYVPARNFAEALVARLRALVPAAAAVAGAAPAAAPLTVATLKQAVNNVGDAQLKQSLMALLDRAERSAATAEAQIRSAFDEIERWYDAAMDHASGWYKRKVRWFLLLIAGVLTVVMNADSVQVALRLAEDSDLRSRVSALAEQTAPPGSDEEKQLAKLRDELGQQLAGSNALNAFGALPVGWGVCKDEKGVRSQRNCYPTGTVQDYATAAKLFGLFLTALLAALGAPFWFGLLQQVNAIRSAGPKPTSSTAGTS